VAVSAKVLYLLKLDLKVPLGLDLEGEVGSMCRSKALSRLQSDIAFGSIPQILASRYWLAGFGPFLLCDGWG